VTNSLTGRNRDAFSKKSMKGRDLSGKHRRTWENNIKMDFSENSNKLHASALGPVAGCCKNRENPKEDSRRIELLCLLENSNIDDLYLERNGF
jgi:hypothetical protein